VSTWLIAVAAGAVGSVLTAALAIGARLLAVRDRYDQPLRRHRDEDLACWVADRSLALERELAAKTDELNKENLFYSGAHALALIKERALHEYRDQERQAERDVAPARERDTWLHAFWRRRRGRPFPKLTVGQRAQPVLGAWRWSVIVMATRRSRSSTRRGARSMRRSRTCKSIRRSSSSLAQMASATTSGGGGPDRTAVLSLVRRALFR
jgi:hypothetical protein